MESWVISTIIERVIGSGRWGKEKREKVGKPSWLMGKNTQHSFNHKIKPCGSTLDICNFCDTDVQYMRCLLYLRYLQWGFFQSEFLHVTRIFVIFAILICDICNICDIWDICDSDRNSAIFPIFAIACISGHKSTRQAIKERQEIKRKQAIKARRAFKKRQEINWKIGNHDKTGSRQDWRSRQD